MSSVTSSLTIVVGASRGIGLAVSQALKAGGTRLTGVASNSASFRDPAQKALFENTLACDLADPSQVASLVEHIDGLPSLAGCVCNAGINITGDILDYAREDMETMYRVNLSGLTQIAQASARAMLRGGTKRGGIVFVSSIWAERSRKGRAVYSMTKAGLLGLMRGMAVDLAEQGIRVNAVSPGFTETELTARTNSPEQIVKLSASVPMQRLAQPSEIAEVVAFLLSDKASYITGQNMVVDGGFSIV